MLAHVAHHRPHACNVPIEWVALAPRGQGSPRSSSTTTSTPTGRRSRRVARGGDCPRRLWLAERCPACGAQAGVRLRRALLGATHATPRGWRCTPLAASGSGRARHGTSERAVYRRAGGQRPGRTPYRAPSARARGAARRRGCVAGAPKSSSRWWGARATQRSRTRSRAPVWGRYGAFKATRKSAQRCSGASRSARCCPPATRGTERYEEIVQAARVTGPLGLARHVAGRRHHAGRESRVLPMRRADPPAGARPRKPGTAQTLPAGHLARPGHARTRACSERAPDIAASSSTSSEPRMGERRFARRVAPNSANSSRLRFTAHASCLVP